MHFTLYSAQFSVLKHSCAVGRRFQTNWYYHGVLEEFLNAPYMPTYPSPPAAPGDYEDRSYQVVFNVTTQTGTLVVFTETDNIIENDEDFTAVLSVPAGLPRVFEGTPSEATVTILDQTTAEVYFDPATYNVTEGQPADLILRLTRDVDPSVTIIVRVQTIDGSATGVCTKKCHPTQTCTKT